MPRIPAWIKFYTVFTILGALCLSGAAMVFPTLLFPALDATPQQMVPIGLYAIRNFAVAVALAFALYRRSIQMLLVLFLFRFIVDILDFVHFVYFGYGYESFWGMCLMVAAFLLILWLPLAFALRWLFKAAKSLPD